MSGWQMALTIVVGAAVLLGCAFFIGECSGKELQRTADELEWVTTKAVLDSTIAQLSKALPAVHDTTYKDRIKWRDDPALRQRADSAVADAQRSEEKARALAEDYYKLSLDAWTDTNVTQRDSSILGPVIYRSDVHQEYSPRHRSFMLDLHNSTLEFPQLATIQTKTILGEQSWWGKPGIAIGAAAAGYGIGAKDLRFVGAGIVTAFIVAWLDH
jgi:hypothetical protein